MLEWYTGVFRAEHALSGEALAASYFYGKLGYTGLPGMNFIEAFIKGILLIGRFGIHLGKKCSAV